jgi:glycosyltransferase involved in cell wall biosynthesis
MFAPRVAHLKILLVSHGYPPRAPGGVETYTADLARGLARRGHAVDVLAARKEISLPDLSWQESQDQGVRVHELVNNLFHERFEETWAHPEIERLFAERVAALAPEVVHFQHLLNWSFGCARVPGARVYFTLHDYWLGCPRFGQRRHPDGAICERIVFERCGTCLSSFTFSQSGLQRGVGRTLAGVRALTGIDLGPLARRAAPLRGAPAADGARAAAFAEAARARTQAALHEVLPQVRRFFAPSRFLRERFLAEWPTVAPERVLYMPFGFESAPEARRRREGPLRVAFLGSLVAVKGPQLLLEAWSRLDPALRARAELELCGPRDHEPAFQAELDRLAAGCGARIHGPLPHAQVPALLARTDLLVVPSLWWENAPLVIHEALAARTPLLVSDAGGMAELVEPGISGWRFPLGDAAALASELARLLQQPELLRALACRAQVLPTPAEHFEALEREYAR